MALRQRLLENVAADLEYNPRRGALYLGLGALALAACVLGRGCAEYTFVPSVVALGGLALVIKGLFMFRRQSAGLGTTEESLLGSPGPRVPTTPIPLAADASQRSLPERGGQLMQDFAIRAAPAGASDKSRREYSGDRITAAHVASICEWRVPLRCRVAPVPPHAR